MTPLSLVTAMTMLSRSDQERVQGALIGVAEGWADDSDHAAMFVVCVGVIEALGHLLEDRSPADALAAVADALTDVLLPSWERELADCRTVEDLLGSPPRGTTEV